uniref:Uncharacterized protein n=1 Tax=Romanomermis culicivorax TaxID=13658 RepID=A0A915KW46_ROMCU
MPMKTWKLEFPTPQTADSRTVASSSFDLNSLISKLPKEHLTVVSIRYLTPCVQGAMSVEVYESRLHYESTPLKCSISN